jgi:pilus assembly protein CpaE
MGLESERMTYNVLLGIADSTLAGQAADLMAEDGDLTVVGSAQEAGDVMSGLASEVVDVVVLHEDIGPLPVMDLAREVGQRYPQVSIVLVVRERTPEILRSALQAGARDVLAVPLSFEELQGVKAAAAWTQQLRERARGETATSMSLGIGGQLVAVAGAKGGTGCSTVALNLALSTTAAGRGRSVCLVDFDLQSGDIGILLDLSHRRSVHDLLDVAHELSPRVLEDALYVHQSGLRVLLAPENGEQEEDVNAPAARRILGGLKSNFDVVIVDVGTVVTEANAVAIDMADRVLMVSTPDVPSLRAANRLLELWNRLEIRAPKSDKGSEVLIVLNRAHRDSEVQPDLVRKVVEAPLAQTVIPAGFRDLEPAVNTGVPSRLSDGSLKGSFTGLADEVGLIPSEEKKKSKVRAGQPRRLLGQSGQAAVETVGLAFLIILIALFAFQMVLVGLTYVVAGHGAREGARALSVGENVNRTVSEETHSIWRGGLDVDEGDDFVRVTLQVPMIVPGVGSPFEVNAQSGAVVEGQSMPAFETEESTANEGGSEQ